MHQRSTLRLVVALGLFPTLARCSARQSAAYAPEILRRAVTAHKRLGPVTIRFNVVITENGRNPPTTVSGEQQRNDSNHSLTAARGHLAGEPLSTVRIYRDGNHVVVFHVGKDKWEQHGAKWIGNPETFEAWAQTVATVDAPNDPMLQVVEAWLHPRTSQDRVEASRVRATTVAYKGRPAWRLSARLPDDSGTKPGARRGSSHMVSFALVIDQADFLVRRVSISQPAEGTYSATYEYTISPKPFPKETFAFAPPAENWNNIDWEHLSAYLARLARATDPAGVSLRTRIANGPSDLAAEMEACRKDGIPLDYADLHIPTVPNDQNAAVDLKGKFDFWDGISDKDGVLIDLMETRRSLPGPDVACLRNRYDRLAPALDKLERALAKPYFVIERRGLDPGTEFPFFANARSMAKFLKDDATLMAIEGRPREAVALLAKGFRLGAFLEQDPTLISYLVGSAIDSIIVSGMKEALWSAGQDDAVAQDVQAAVATAGPFVPLSRILKAAVVENHTSMDQMRKEGNAAAFGNAIGDKASQVKLAAKPSNPEEARFALNLCDAAEARYLHGMRENIAAADKPYPDAIKDFERTQAMFAKPSDPIGKLISTVMSTSWADMNRIWTSEAAGREVARTAAAVMTYRAHYGKFPENLAFLPSPPVDPFKDASLGYRTEPNGFVVYCHGPNGTFEGGKPGDKAPQRTPLFRYPAPPVISEADYYVRRAKSAKEYKAKQERDPIGGLQIQAVAASADGRFVASALGGLLLPETTISIWRPNHPGRARSFKVAAPISTLAFSPDSKVLACAGREPAVKLYEAASGRLISSLSATDSVKALAFSPIGHTLATPSADGQVTLWDWRTGKTLLSLKASPHYAFSAAFSPDSKVLVTGGDYDGSIRFWNPRTGALLQASPAHTNSVVGLAYSPDGRYFATSSWDGTAKLWDAKRRIPLWTFKGHSFNVWSTAFSPDGRLLATVSGELKVWDVKTRKLLLTKAVDADNIAWLRESRRIAVGIGQTVRILTVPPRKGN